MSTVLFTNVEKIETIFYITATCEKKEAKIIISEHYIQVICMNASARIQRLPMGKIFDSFDGAINAYKSSEMKSILESAKSEFGNRGENVI